MPDAIVEVRLTPRENSLRLAWGMTVAEGKWLWGRKQLEVRLYCQPFPDFGKAELTDMPLSDRERVYGSSFSLPFINLGYQLNKEVNRNAFRTGTVFASPDGKCYPLYFDLEDEDLPAGAVVTYPAVEWEVKTPDWLKEAHTFWVDFGYTLGNTFYPVGDRHRYEYTPDENKADTTLPDVTISKDQRVQRRGAAPKLFVSYSHANTSQVAPLAQRLSREQYYDVWVDYDSIPGGSKWREEIAIGVQGAHVVLFMMTPESCASDFCKAEIEHALKHDKKIIPVRLNSKTAPEILAQVGLSSEYQFIDYTGADDKTNWEKLLRDLPVVLKRDRALLDPKNRNLHIDYLRSIFTRLGEANLSYLLDAAPREKVKLIDVYVPLKYKTQFFTEFESYSLKDWWLSDRVESLERPNSVEIDFDDTGATNVRTIRPKEIMGFQPQGNALKAWLNLLTQVWESKLDDDNFYYSRFRDTSYTTSLLPIESEIALALMPHLVITGDPGSGKTTLAKHLALCMAGDMQRILVDDAAVTLDNLGFWPHPAYTPLYIELRAMIGESFRDASDHNITPALFLTYVKEHLLKPYAVENYDELLRDQLRDGDVMIFLDGLDEVPEADDEQRRKQIKELVRMLQTTYRNCRIVVTSRPYAYKSEDWQVNDFGHVELASLDEDRLKELALKLFTVVYRDAVKATTEADSFVKRMDANKYPAEIRSSPLFFTLLAGIWLLEKDKPAETRLPKEKGAIYRRCVDVMIRRWTYKDADGKSTTDLIGLDEMQLRQVLEMLAYTVHKSSDDGDAALFKIGDITNVLDELDLYEQADSRELKDALAQRAGLIYAPSPKRFKFAHRSFQEHLAACYLKSENTFPKNIPTLLEGSLNLWRNVLELLPGELDKEKLWRLVEVLLPVKDAPPPNTSDDTAWYRLYYGLHWMKTYNIPTDDDYRLMNFNRQQTWLVRLIELGALTPAERAEMGRLLAEIGDPRPSVGLRTDGLPDIQWGKDVPVGDYTISGDPDSYRSLDEPYTVEFAYKLAKYPVTYAQFQAFVDASDGIGNDDLWNESARKQKEPFEQKNKYDNHPRENVSWYQAVAFCAWLTIKYRDAGLIAPGEEIRLPTEQEWEVAARFPDGRKFPYGDEYDANKANVSRTEIGQTSAVGMFPDGRNEALDIYDLSGNVWEWTWTEHKSGKQGDVNLRASRVLRGGSFNFDGYESRADYRNGNVPAARNSVSGFRLCVVCCLPSE
ncbi:MAG: SUMF1/EgtB/PvdO family nonheme iron enzyme [Aggregatilineales bacterium]